jgi:RNA polymerase sigma-70 factor, ECF subfamily
MKRAIFSEALLDILAAERVGDMAHTNARHDALEHCMGKLDDSGRQLVEAAYVEGSDIGLLAEQLGRARQTLYNKLNIIRRSLADCVTQLLAEEANR